MIAVLLELLVFTSAALAAIYIFIDTLEAGRVWTFAKSRLDLIPLSFVYAKKRESPV